MIKRTTNSPWVAAYIVFRGGKVLERNWEEGKCAWICLCPKGVDFFASDIFSFRTILENERNEMDASRPN